MIVFPAYLDPALNAVPRTNAYHAFIDFDEPEPGEEFDDDDLEDEADERNALTDTLEFK